MFEYKEIDKISGLLRHDFLVMYTEKLQAYCVKIEDELYRIREERSKDGNRFYQRDAQQLKRENEKLQHEVYSLKCKLAELEGQQKAKNRDYEQRIEALKENQVVQVETIADTRPRDNYNGRFLNQGKTANNARECYNRIVLGGEDPGTVADDLHIAATTAERYARRQARTLAETARKNLLCEDPDRIVLADGFTVLSRV